MKSQNECDTIEPNLSNLTFYIQDSKITVHPKGLLDPIYKDSAEALGDDWQDKKVFDYCLIGIESVPDTENHYRLGV